LTRSAVVQQRIASGRARRGWRDRLGLLLPITVALLFFAGLALRVGSTDGYRFYRAIAVGSLFEDPSLLPADLKPAPTVGLDGQFYYYIAQDPFLRNPYTARALDNNLRYRRILYPLLAWLLSGGRRGLLPYVLIAINVVACTAVAAAAAVASRRAGQTAWLALAVAIFPGVWVSLTRDMTEPLQLALATWGLLLESALLLFLSSLAKETTAIVQLTEGIRNLVGGRMRPAARNLLLLALLLGWALAVSLFVHAHSSNLTAQFLDPPWAPFSLLLQSTSNPALYACLVPNLAICLLAVARLARTRDRYALAAGAYAVVGILAGNTTWIDPFAEFRITALAGVLVFMSWVSARDRMGAVVVMLMLLTGVLGLAVALLP
jgi:hypothetical protein